MSRYSRHLPEGIAELKEFQTLGRIEGAVLEEEAAAKEEMVRNQWIVTADRTGLLRYAAMMGLEGRGKETETLRGEVLFRWNFRSPYPFFYLLDWLDGFCGADGYTAELFREEYRLEIWLELRNKGEQGFLEEYLRRVIPANIVLAVRLNRNTHGKLKPFTHRRMKGLGWKYGGISYEDLSGLEEAGIRRCKRDSGV